MSNNKNKTIEKPIVHFSKSGSPYVSVKEVLKSTAGKTQIDKLRNSSLLKNKK